MSDGFTLRKFRWLERIAKDPNLPLSAARFAIVLAGYFNRETGEAWPSMGRLARDLGMTRQGVQKVIAALVSQGYVVREIRRGKGTTNIYRMCGELPQNAPIRVHEPAENANAGLHKDAPDANSSWHPLPTPVGYLEKPMARTKLA